MGPPITYLLDGKQYVSFMGGVGQLPTQNPGGRGATPATASSPTTAPTPKLFTYVLDGNGLQTK